MGKSLPLQEAELQLGGLLSGESDLIANLANFTAFLADQLDRINWLGFYFLSGSELVLGPFQGRPACVRIPVGKGVCGTAARDKATQMVPDVHTFPGHIACDPQSRSELVVPVFRGGDLYGVLDIDSPITDRFTRDDAVYVEQLVDVFCRHQFS